MSEAIKTTDHETVRKWAEQRGGKPAHVKPTADGDDPGILRIDFPGGDQARLETISWEEFFDKFDAAKLALLYQEQTESGELSRFNKLVNR